jgi:hypothetical protein
VRTSERSCPFCRTPLSLREPIEELRLLTRLDRSRLASLGAVLSAAGIALGCREPPVAIYGAPAAPVAPSASGAAPPPPSAPTATPSSALTGAPVAVYGAPPVRKPGE